MKIPGIELFAVVVDQLNRSTQVVVLADRELLGRRLKK